MTGTWDCEITDTFGDEANYGWVRRAAVELPEGASDLQVARACKAALGLSGVRGRMLRFGDDFEFRPSASNTVAFFTFRY